VPESKECNYEADTRNRDFPPVAPCSHGAKTERGEPKAEGGVNRKKRRVFRNGPAANGKREEGGVVGRLRGVGREDPKESDNTTRPSSEDQAPIILYVGDQGCTRGGEGEKGEKNRS